MTQGLCLRNKFAFCKFSEKCRFRHINQKCLEKNCSIYNCEKRHPKICKHFREYGYCKFTTYCKYQHEKQVHIAENSDKIAELEKKIDTMKTQKINNKDNNHEQMAVDQFQEKLDAIEKTMEKKIEVFEHKLESQRRDLEEKNAKINALEMRLEELENKFTSEKKCKDKKIRELEKTVKSKSDDAKKQVTKVMLNCKYCDFKTSSERGLKVHIRRKHTILTEADYPAECDFCDLKLISESDMKMHLKESHIHTQSKFKCEDCDFYCENELSIEVHHGRCHNEDFECGLCEYKAGNIENLNIHLSTCEIYECDNCFFRVKVLSHMEDHMDEKHAQENLNIIHGKVDRKNENCIKTTEHLKNELFL